MGSTDQAGHGAGEHPWFRNKHPQGQPDAPLVVADELDRIHSSGVRARWANFHKAEVARREFEAWILSPTEGPLPPLHPDSGLNCQEMLLRAAVRKNVLTHAELHRMYEPIAKYRRRWWVRKIPKDWGETIARALLPHEKRHYRPGDSADLQPQRGDVIVWNDANHVAMATGRMARDGSPEVYSFWPPPKGELKMDPVTTSWGAVTDAVQITSIVELTPFVRKDGPPPDIWFGRGPW